MRQNNIVEVLANHPMIPVVTIHNELEIEEIIQALLARNISCIEVTLRTDFAMEAIRIIREKYRAEITLGVGTVINEQQVDQLTSIGPDFIVSPGLTKKLGAYLTASKIAFIPGVSTPSEIISALEDGYNTLKFFPANLFGGVTALKTYAAVFPNATFCPTGGVNEETYQEYLSLPNVICVGGSWMVK